jgi:hypothetical protein
MLGGGYHGRLFPKTRRAARTLPGDGPSDPGGDNVSRRGRVGVPSSASSENPRADLAAVSTHHGPHGRRRGRTRAAVEAGGAPSGTYATVVSPRVPEPHGGFHSSKPDLTWIIHIVAALRAARDFHGVDPSEGMYRWPIRLPRAHSPPPRIVRPTLLVSIRSQTRGEFMATRPSRAGNSRIGSREGSGPGVVSSPTGARSRAASG